MNAYTTLVSARNRALASDPSFEQRTLYQFFQRALDELDSTHPETMGKIVRIAEWYVSQPSEGEG